MYEILFSRQSQRQFSWQDQEQDMPGGSFEVGMIVRRVVEAIRNTDPSLAPIAEWPLSVFVTKPFPTGGTVDIEVFAEDMSLGSGSGVEFAVSFRLKTGERAPSTLCVFRANSPRALSCRLVQFVTNTECFGDDFVVPEGTPEEESTRLMKASVNERREYLRGRLERIFSMPIPGVAVTL